MLSFFFFQAEDGIRDIGVTGVQTCALPICHSFRENWHKNDQITQQYIKDQRHKLFNSWITYTFPPNIHYLQKNIKDQRYTLFNCWITYSFPPNIHYLQQYIKDQRYTLFNCWITYSFPPNIHYLQRQNHPWVTKTTKQI